MSRNTPDECRVVIVGAGIVGLSIAFHLSRFDRYTVAIVDKGRIGEGATAYATGGIRCQFSSVANIQLSQRSLAFWRCFEQHTGYPFDLRHHGFLFLGSTPQVVDQFKRNVALQQSLDVDVDLLTPQDAGKLFPGLRTDDVLAATYSPADGSASPADAVQGFAGAARSRGVEILQYTEMLGLRTGGGGEVRGVRTSAGDIPADSVVLATGPQTRRVGQLCEVDLPVDPHSRQAFATGRIPGLGGDLPLTVDLGSGAYLHPEKAGTALIGGNDRDTGPSEEPRVDQDRLESLIAAVSHRFPGLGDVPVVGGWAGLREMTPDDHPIVGPIDGVDGLWVAAGFSGHGFMQAPAVGAQLAEWFTDGLPSMDLSALSLNRFRGPRLERELVVF